MEPEEKRSSGARAFLLLLVCGGMLPGVYLYLNWPSQDSALNTSGFNVNRVKTEAGGSPPARRSEPGPYSPPSSLDMIRRGSGDLSASPEETKTPDSTAASQLVQTNRGSDTLSVEDVSILKKTMGGFDSNTVHKAGTEPSFGYKVATVLFSYPRGLRFLLNNETFVNAVMKRETAQRNCNSVQSLKQGIMDTKDPQGVTQGLRFVRDSTRYPGATQAILGSKLALTLSQCPALTKMIQNPDMLAEAFMGNPQLIQALADPNIAQALNSNPSTQRVLGGSQAVLFSPGKQ